jgi:hypothetical protein
MTVTVFIPDLPEFRALVECAADVPDCVVTPLGNGYLKLETPRQLRFLRKELGLGPALWNSALSGGFRGRIERYDRNEMLLVSEDTGTA